MAIRACRPHPAVGLSPTDLDKIDEVVAVRRKIKRGAALFRNGENFTSLYAIRTGFFKTCVTSGDGRDQVTGFQMAGEIIGLDGIVNDHHTCDAVALEDAEVCVMPFDRIGELSREIGALQRHVHRIMSREIVREHGVMLLLGTMRAEERVAAFLLNLVQRLQAGERIAYVSDAGTPAVSDPGARAVARVQDAGFPVVPVPGACAAIAALNCR